jgi:hypothetical protein
MDLQPPRVVLDDAAELAQTDDTLPRQVADVGDAVERQQVVHSRAGTPAVLPSRDAEQRRASVPVD